MAQTGGRSTASPRAAQQEMVGTARFRRHTAWTPLESDDRHSSGNDGARDGLERGREDDWPQPDAFDKSFCHNLLSEPASGLRPHIKRRDAKGQRMPFHIDQPMPTQLLGQFFTVGKLHHAGRQVVVRAVGTV